MKSIKLLILLFLILSCSIIGYNDNPCRGMTEYQIGQWIMNNFEGKSDLKQFLLIDYWQSVTEMLDQWNKSGVIYGDCEDYTILYIYMVNLNLGKEYGAAVKLEDEGLHVIVDKGVNGYFEPQKNLQYTLDYPTIIKISYDEIINWSSWFDRKNIDMGRE
jgi:hypothetical protein